MAILTIVHTSEVFIGTRKGIPTIVHAIAEIIIRNTCVAVLTNILTAEIFIGTRKGVPTIVHTVAEVIFRNASMAILTNIIVTFRTFQGLCKAKITNVHQTGT